MRFEICSGEAPGRLDGRALADPGELRRTPLRPARGVRERAADDCRTHPGRCAACKREKLSTRAWSVRCRAGRSRSRSRAATHSSGCVRQSPAARWRTPRATAGLVGARRGPRARDRRAAPAPHPAALKSYPHTWLGRYSTGPATASRRRRSRYQKLRRNGPGRVYRSLALRPEGLVELVEASDERLVASGFGSRESGVGSRRRL
jgi:hypothetical protein